MKTQESDLHGNAPDKCPVALVIIDMINDLEFPEGPELLKPTLAVAKKLKTLKAKARALKIPVVYANDNFGRWRSDFNEVIEHCLHDNVRGQHLAELLRPHPDDYFVLKPKNSAFYATTLDTLLTYLGTKCLILTGISADSCVLFSANDAYMRDFTLCIPSDCVVSASPTHTKQAMAYMKRVLKADTTPSTKLNLHELKQSTTSGQEEKPEKP